VGCVSRGGVVIIFVFFPVVVGETQTFKRTIQSKVGLLGGICNEVLENSTGCLPVGLSGVFEELQIEINCK
jgi:hypothetical protein